jgi:hypothetical protein
VREGGNGKWILQKFKELPVEFRGDENELEAPTASELLGVPVSPAALPRAMRRSAPAAAAAAALDDID